MNKGTEVNKITKFQFKGGTFQILNIKVICTEVSVRFIVTKINKKR